MSTPTEQGTENDVESLDTVALTLIESSSKMLRELGLSGQRM